MLHPPLHVRAPDVGPVEEGPAPRHLLLSIGVGQQPLTGRDRYAEVLRVQSLGFEGGLDGRVHSAPSTGRGPALEILAPPDSCDRAPISCGLGVIRDRLRTWELLVATILSMRAVGIRTLKNKLSEYVRIAAAGETAVMLSGKEKFLVVEGDDDTIDLIVTDLASDDARDVNGAEIVVDGGGASY